MKIKSQPRNHVIEACLAVILAASAGAGAADAGDSDAKKKDVLSVHVVLPEQPVVARTRVAITVKIKNISDEPVDLPWPKFINQFIHTESTHHGGTVLTIRHTGLSMGHGPYAGGDLKPSEEMVVEVWHIFQDTGWHSFKCAVETSRKGTPWWSFWEGRVESKPVSVEVKPSPHQAADKPVSERQDSTPWPTKLEAFDYFYMPKVLGSQVHLGMNRSGYVSYSFLSEPYTGSGGRTVSKEWHIPKDEAQQTLDALVNAGILELGLDGEAKFPSHCFTVSSKGWQKAIRPARLPDSIWKQMLPLMIRAHPEMWQENTKPDAAAEADKPRR